MRLGANVLLIGVLALAPLQGAAQPDAPAVPGAAPAREDVRKALDKVANDPNLVDERMVNMLRWKQAEPVTDEPWWWEWLNAAARWFRGLFAWIATSGRLVVWVLGAALAALLALYILRLIRARGVPRARMSRRMYSASHVRDLDIRPESLPGDVGAAALALWERGEQRAALALLYRGLLSRLVHAHAVPIRASSTEGECLALARYASRLVETWAAAVYGGLAPDAGAVRALCNEFHVALDSGAAAS